MAGKLSAAPIQGGDVEAVPGVVIGAVPDAVIEAAPGAVIKAVPGVVVVVGVVPGAAVTAVLEEAVPEADPADVLTDMANIHKIIQAQ